MKPMFMRRTPANAQIYCEAFNKANDQYPDAFGVPGRDMEALFMDREVTTLAIPTCVGSVVGAVSVYMSLPSGAWGMYRGGISSPPEIGYLFRHQQAGSQAVGRLLLAGALDYLAQRQADEVHLDVVETNNNARQLYESLGFVEHRIKETEVGAILGLVLEGTESIKQAHIKLQNQL